MSVNRDLERLNEGLICEGDAAKLLGVKPSYLKSLRQRRKLPFIRLGHRTVRYRRSDLMATAERLVISAGWERGSGSKPATSVA